MDFETWEKENPVYLFVDGIPTAERLKEIRRAAWAAALSSAPAVSGEPCENCDGVGSIRGVINPDAPNHEIDCPVCNGTGNAKEAL